MAKIYKNIFKWALGISLLSFVYILPNCIDILHFSAIFLLGLVAYRYGNGQAAFFTVISDFFLIFTPFYHAGIFFFCLVHLCYMKGIVKKMNFLLPAQGLLLIFVLPLELAAGVYACFFATHFFVTIKFKDHFSNQQYHLYMVALLLFVLCDISIAFGQNNTLVWLFYLPSQLLLSFTAQSFSSEGSLQNFREL